MYKHLTPQEISEFEKLYVSWVVYEPKFSGEMLGEAGLKLKKDALSFIDTLIGKRVGEIEKLKGKPNHNELFFMGACLIVEGK